MSIARLYLSEAIAELVARWQAASRLLDQCDAGPSSHLVSRGPGAALRAVGKRVPSGRASPSGFRLTRLPRHTVVWKRVVSMASLSCARTSRRGAIGLEAIRDVRGPGADILIRAYSDTNIEVTGQRRRPCQGRDQCCRVGASALCVCRAKFWLPRCTPKTLYTLVSTAKVRRLTTKRIQIAA